MIHFEIPGHIHPKGRPRATVIAGRPRLYTPSETVHFEEKVYLVACQHRPSQPYLGPVEVDITVRVSPPARPLSFVLYRHKKPDLDNYVKSILDGLKELFWKDDSQIAVLKAQKIHSRQPGAWITIRELKQKRPADVQSNGPGGAK